MAGKKGGRPSIWTPEIEKAVIEAMEQTGSYTEAAEIAGVSRQVIIRQEAKSDEFRTNIARAREAGYLARAEKAVVDAKTAKDPQAGRLAFDADRWLLGKLNPARFGDKVQHTGDGGGAIQHLTKVVLADLETDEP